jgi:hypothetical protein
MPYKDPAKNAACKKAYSEKNREQERIRLKKWREDNPEKVKKASAQWRKTNKDKKAEQSKSWRENNRAEYNALQAKRRAIKLQATPNWLTKEQRQEIVEFYKMAKELEKVFPWKQHVDHIIPLNNENVCGWHVPWNLQILSVFSNQSKGNSLI